VAEDTAELAITVEQAGGVAQSSQPATMSGELKA
jgi:hypothetical protein